MTPAYFGAETVSAYQGSLDADLASVLSGMAAAEYSAVTLTGDTDPLGGHAVLVVDGNGTAGYTAVSDYDRHHQLHRRPIADPLYLTRLRQ